MWKVPEQYRITEAVAGKLDRMFPGGISPRVLASWISTEAVGPRGFFMLPRPSTMKGLYMLTQADNLQGWEHVSVSVPTENRCPTWQEMCFVKSLFWDTGDCVVQFHPPEREYVNNHEFCLHLWKPTGYDIATPPSYMVGTKK